MTIDLYDYEDTPVSKYADVPPWIEQDIDCGTVAAILEGGCASGAYMPAVTYHKALETMNEHGDAVFEHLEDAMGELPEVPKDARSSWAGMACFYVSAAVESWASIVESEIEQAIEEADAE